MPMISPRLPFIRSCIAPTLHSSLGRQQPAWPANPDTKLCNDAAGILNAPRTRSMTQSNSRIQPLEHQRGVGAAEAERVRQHGAELGVVDALAHDRHVGENRIEFVDVRALAD